MRIRDIVVGAFTLAVAVTATSSVATAGPNLIANGDFTAGFNGFTTQYDILAPAPNALFPEGAITIADNPNSVHQYWVDLGTNYPLLLVNGATSGSPVIWEEDNIPTSAGGTYQFGANVMDICCNASFGTNSNSPSDISFQVNVNRSGWTDLSDYLTAPGAVAESGDSGILQFIDGGFTSTAGGEFDIRAINNFDVAGGNDFALTNISVTAVPEPFTIALFGAGLVAIATMRRRKTAAQA
jgi:hypothetical protein